MKAFQVVFCDSHVAKIQSLCFWHQRIILFNLISDTSLVISVSSETSLILVDLDFFLHFYFIYWLGCSLLFSFLFCGLLFYRGLQSSGLTLSMWPPAAQGNHSHCGDMPFSWHALVKAIVMASQTLMGCCPWVLERSCGSHQHRI